MDVLELTCKWATESEPQQSDICIKGLTYERELVRSAFAGRHEIHSRYAGPYSMVNLAFDDELLAQVTEYVDRASTPKPDTLVIIGIGGSSMGSQAVYHAVQGLLHNEMGAMPQIFFVDTVDPVYTHGVAAIVERDLIARKCVLIVVVTKSGATAETIANFKIFYELLRRHRPSEYKQSLFIISEEGSCLHQFAHKDEINHLAMPHSIGGRYSVLSVVGLFPLAMMNVDIKQLREGARALFEHELECLIEESFAARVASFAYAHWLANYTVFDLFVFGKQLESLGRWYRQLVGEGLGKMPTSGRGQTVSLVPTVSLGTNDLHSVGQLYMGGASKIMTFFVTVGEWPSNLITPAGENGLEQIVPGLNGKSLAEIMQATWCGVGHAYQLRNNPYIHSVLPQLSPYWIGSWMAANMLAVVYLARLLGVNPYDQPAVESYKQQTRSLLGF